MQRETSGERKRLGSTHEAIVFVLQRTDHGRRVSLFDLLLRDFGRLSLVELLLVQGELDGVGGRLRPQVVHPRLQTLWTEGGHRLTGCTSSKTKVWRVVVVLLSLFSDLSSRCHSPVSSRRSACWSVCRSWAQRCGCSWTGSGRCRRRGRQPSSEPSSGRSPTRFYKAASDRLESH